MGDRRASVVREITKLYEEIRRANLQHLIEVYQDKDTKIKGEIVVVIEAPGEQDFDEDEIKEKLKELLRKHSKKEAAKLLSNEVSMSSKDLYAMALQLDSSKL